jgi:hypothetical protein
MHNVTNQVGLVSIESPIDELGSIVSEIISLIEHVRGGIAAIETEFMREQRCSNRDDVVNVIVLNDVTPRYARASAALNTCRASLCTAPNVLAGKRSSRRVICQVRRADAGGRACGGSRFQNPRKIFA